MLLALVGAVALTALIATTDSRTVLHILAGALVFLPAALLLETARVVIEGYATLAQLGSTAERVPLGNFVRIHVIANAVANVAPAGRAVAEGLKGALLSKHLERTRCTAIAVTNQALSMVGDAALAVLVLVACLWHDASKLLCYATLAQAAICAAGAAAMLAALRSERLERLLTRLPLVGRAVRGLHCESQRPLLRPALAWFASKLMRLPLVLLALHAVGAHVGAAAMFRMQAVSGVAGVVGDFVPGQLGASDAVFALAASDLGATATLALSLNGFMHAVRLSSVLIAPILVMLLRDPVRSPSNSTGCIAAGARVPSRSSMGGPAVVDRPLATELELG